jgi:ribonuclease Y
VFISSFDLYRRYVAKVSLEKLLEDKRIQPARIEEIVENTKGEADILLKNIGQKTLDELDIKPLPEEIVKLI